MDPNQQNTVDVDPNAVNDDLQQIFNVLAALSGNPIPPDQAIPQRIPIQPRPFLILSNEPPYHPLPEQHQQPQPHSPNPFIPPVAPNTTERVYLTAVIDRFPPPPPAPRPQPRRSTAPHQQQVRRVSTTRRIAFYTITCLTVLFAILVLAVLGVLGVLMVPSFVHGGMEVVEKVVEMRGTARATAKEVFREVMGWELPLGVSVGVLVLGWVFLVLF